MARQTHESRLRGLAIRQQGDQLEHPTTPPASPTEQLLLPKVPEPTPRGRSPTRSEQDFSEPDIEFRAENHRDKSPLTWLHKREPRPGASQLDKFVCYALNKLQGPLMPTSEMGTRCFHSESKEAVALCDQDDTWNDFYLVHILIMARKTKLPSGAEVYNLAAFVACCGTRDEYTWLLGAGEDLKVLVRTDWIDDKSKTSESGEGENTSRWDSMGFKEALLLLRRAAKKKYNRFGELRSDEEAKAPPSLGNPRLTVWGLMPGQLEVPRKAQNSVGKEVSGALVAPLEGQESADRTVLDMTDQAEALSTEQNTSSAGIRQVEGVLATETNEDPSDVEVVVDRSHLPSSFSIL